MGSSAQHRIVSGRCPGREPGGRGSPMDNSYYDLLEVPPDASTEAILNAYRERLKETHPDVSDDDDAGERTRQLIEAKEVLTDETERARYDRLGHEQYVTAEDTPDYSGGPADRWWTATGDPGADGTGPTASDSTESRDSGSHAGATSRSAGTSGRADNSGGHDRWGTSTDATSSRNHQGASGGATRGRDQQNTSNDDTGGGDGKSTAGGHGRHTQRNSWRDGGFTDENGAAGGATWNAWNTESAYAVRGEAKGMLGSRLFPSSQSVILLAATFVLYPVLLGGALAPPFPLLVNLVLALCLVLTIAYLQSIPEIGILVFGAWTVLLPAIVVGLLQQPLFSLSVGIALASTALPLGLSILTRAVIRY
jgi:molecular chaperone DnaJ